MIAGLRDDLRGLLLGDDMTPVPRPSDPPPTRPALDVGDKAARFRARQRQKQATESGRGG